MYIKISFVPQFMCRKISIVPQFVYRKISFVPRDKFIPVAKVDVLSHNSCIESFVPLDKFMYRKISIVV